MKTIFKSYSIALLIAGMAILQINIVHAHGGGVNKEGCHFDRKAGSRHCHAGKATEDTYNAIFCKSVGGKTEVRHDYEVSTGKHQVLMNSVIVDCETATHVYEGGLDKRSSLDSLQQALVFAELTGKTPAVVIYDTDNKAESYEYRIMTACQKAGVEFILKRYSVPDRKTVQP